MDILDKIKLFINDSLQSLFAKQKDDFGNTIHKESVYIISELKNFASQQSQTNERDMANLQQNVFNNSKSIQILDEKLNLILEKIGKLEDHISEHKYEPTTYGVEDAELSTPIISSFYAKMVDSTEPLGFKVENLKTTDDGCAFKITIINDNEGSYTFIEDNDIQQELLAAFNPLITDSSTFDTLPQNPTRISVEHAGTLIKEENVLRITNKQIIKLS